MFPLAGVCSATQGFNKTGWLDIAGPQRRVHMNFYIQQLTRKAESAIQDCHSQVLRARHLREVAQALHPTIPAEIRSVARSFPGMSRLRAAAEQRAQELLTAHFVELEGLPEDAARKRFDQLSSTDWQHLRGNFPNLCHQVEQRRHQYRGGNTPS